MGSVFNAGTNRLQGADHTLPEPQRLHYCAEGMLSQACQAQTPLCNGGMRTGPSKMLKEYSLLAGFIYSCPFRLKSKGDPISLIYLDVLPVPVSCIWVCFPLLWPKIGTNHTRASVQTTLKRESNKTHAKHNHNV